MADSTEGRWASAVVGTLILATGVLLFIGGFHERHEARGLRARGVVADATVVNTAAEVRVQQVGGVFSAHRVQRVTFDFVDVHNVLRRSTMKFMATNYKVGESVRLVYALARRDTSTSSTPAMPGCRAIAGRSCRWQWVR